MHRGYYFSSTHKNHLLIAKLWLMLNCLCDYRRDIGIKILSNISLALSYCMRYCVISRVYYSNLKSQQIKMQFPLWQDSVNFWQWNQAKPDVKWIHPNLIPFWYLVNFPLLEWNGIYQQMVVYLVQENLMLTRDIETTRKRNVKETCSLWWLLGWPYILIGNKRWLQTVYAMMFIANPRKYDEIGMIQYIRQNNKILKQCDNAVLGLYFMSMLLLEKKINPILISFIRTSGNISITQKLFQASCSR